MTARIPALRWDGQGRLFLGRLPRHVAKVHPHGLAGVSDCVGTIYLPGIERPRAGTPAEVRRAVETAVTGWLAGASA